MRKAFLFKAPFLFVFCHSKRSQNSEVSSNIIRNTEIDVIIPDISIKVLHKYYFQYNNIMQDMLYIEVNRY